MQWLESRRDSGAVSPEVLLRYYFMLQMATSQQSFTVFYPYPEDSHSHFMAHESVHRGMELQKVT